MALGQDVKKIRSKNAGPFWLTIDIFCHDDQNFQDIQRRLDSTAVARLFQTDLDQVLRFDIASLQVIKFSLPRPHIQGTRADTDMHGASFATLLEELDI
jgi:hypothetical protein